MSLAKRRTPTRRRSSPRVFFSLVDTQRGGSTMAIHSSRVDLPTIARLCSNHETRRFLSLRFRDVSRDHGEAILSCLISPGTSRAHIGSAGEAFPRSLCFKKQEAVCNLLHVPTYKMEPRLSDGRGTQCVCSSHHASDTSPMCLFRIKKRSFACRDRDSRKKRRKT